MADLNKLEPQELGEWWLKRDRGENASGAQAVEPTYLEFDMLELPMKALGAAVGMFIPAKATDMGAFSDIYQRKVMKWLSDRNARLRSRKEIADNRRKKYLPEDFDTMSDSQKKDYSEAMWRKEDDFRLAINNSERYSDAHKELSKQRKQQQIVSNWADDPEGEYDWVANKEGMTFDLDEILEHDELFKELPELRKLNVAPEDLSDRDIGGSMDTLYRRMIIDNSNEPSLIYNEDGHNLGTVLHETQHQVQADAKWVPGANTKSQAVANELEYNKKKYDRVVAQSDAIQKQNAQWKKDWQKMIDNGDKEGANALRDKIWRNEDQLEKYDDRMRDIELNLTEDEIYLNQLGEQQSRATGDTATLGGMAHDMAEKDPYAILKGREGFRHPTAGDGDQNIINEPNMLENPAGTSQMVDVGKSPLTPEGLLSYDRAVDLGAGRGSTIHVGQLPKEKRQAIADAMFTRNVGAKGMTGNQSTADVGYFGGTTKMKPLEFLNLAAKRTEGTSDKVKRKDFATNVAQAQAGGTPMEIAPPKLWATIIDDAKIQITGHEGRHRSDMAFDYLGNDVDIPVDLQFRKGADGDDFEHRRRNWDSRFLDMPIINEDGRSFSKTFREMLQGTDVDTSRVGD